MDVKITFRNMESSKPMRNYAEEQLQKVENFLENEKEPVRIDLVFEPSKVHSHHRIEVRVKSPNYNLISNYEGSDFYVVLDRVIDVMYRELLEAKRRRVDERKGVGRAQDYKNNN